MKPKHEKPITVFFQKLPQLLLAGVLFSACMAACTGIFILISLLTGFNSIILWGVGIIPGMLFYAGLVTVIRKYGIENDYVPVVPTFFRAVKENRKAFLLHGFVVYAVCSCSSFAIQHIPRTPRQSAPSRIASASCTIDRSPMPYERMSAFASAITGRRTLSLQKS